MTGRERPEAVNHMHQNTSLQAYDSVKR